MAWLEIISVRTSGGSESNEVMALCGRFTASREVEGAEEIRIFASSGFDTDVSVHIVWRDDPGSKRRSPFGAELVRLLSDYGLINHTIWIELERVREE